MRTLIALGLATLLAGCLGSPEPYRPYKDGTREPRPDPEERAKEDAELKLETELPIELARSEAERERTRKSLGRIMGAIPTNPWCAYDRDLVSTFACKTCSSAQCNGRAHADPHLPKGPPERLALALGQGAAAAPAAKDDEGEGDEDAEEEE